MDYRAGLLDAYGPICRAVLPTPKGTIVILSDERVAGLYGRRLLDSLAAVDLTAELLAVPDGECSKSMEQFARLLDELARVGMDRRGLLVNFGGGVISDLGGFVAAAYMRGIAYANFSTSLIGQLDASIGGKVAINSERAKNLIGAFHHPVHVAGDPLLLETLGARDIRSGIAEAIKVGVIASPPLTELLETRYREVINRDPTTITQVVQLAAQLKIDLLAADPYEADLRRPLNFGHTLGHPIETEFAYRGIRHGEAVAVGMAVATLIARNRNAISEADAARILNLLDAYELLDSTPTIHPELVLKHLNCVRLIRGKQLHFVLPTRIGGVLITDALSNGELLRGFAAYEDLCATRRQNRST